MMVSVVISDSEWCRRRIIVRSKVDSCGICGKMSNTVLCAVCKKIMDSR